MTHDAGHRLPSHAQTEEPIAVPQSAEVSGPGRATMSTPSVMLDDWLSIGEDGLITVFSGKVELGTGVRTALAQIVAEEMDAPLEHVRLVMGDTARTPDEGYTAGSKTIQTSWRMLRLAAAEAKHALLDVAARRLGVPAATLQAHDGVVARRDAPDTFLTYADLMGGRTFQRKITGQAPVKRPDEYHTVGFSAPRVDLTAKFTGQAAFVHDLRLPGMLHARVVRPAGPGAKLQDVASDIPEGAELIRMGSFLAIVAEREEVAIRVADRLTVEWSEPARLPVQTELHDHMRAQPGTEVIIDQQGSLEQELDRTNAVVRARYTFPFQAHASIGPSCAVAAFDGDELTVWCSTQGVFPLRNALAELMEMSVDQVRVAHMEGAGCYGQNGADDVAADAAVLARAIGRPVRVQWSRADEFIWEPKSPAMIQQVVADLDDAGSVRAWDMSVWSPSHANRPRRSDGFVAGQLIHDAPVPASSFFLGGDRNAVTNYVFPNSRVTMHWQARAPLRVSSMRSLGATSNTFANESFVDELAAAARIDPLVFRLRHLDDPRARHVLEVAAARAGWGEPLSPGEGLGIAFARYENIEAYVATVALVHVEAGSGVTQVKRITVAHDCGLIINPDGVRNQIEGNVLQGVSRALKEEVRFTTSRVTSVDWESYPILTFSETPEVDIVLIDQPHEPPVGAGEPATITVAPAIANAIFAATGARVRDVPFTPERILRAMEARALA